MVEMVGREKVVEILPCPFCGNEAVYLWNSRGWKVQCSHRHADCPINWRTHYHSTETEAIRAWNTAALPPLPHQGEGERAIGTDSGGQINWYWCSKHGLAVGFDMSGCPECRASLATKEE